MTCSALVIGYGSIGKRHANILNEMNENEEEYSFKQMSSDNVITSNQQQTTKRELKKVNSL